MVGRIIQNQARLEIYPLVTLPLVNLSKPKAVTVEPIIGDASSSVKVNRRVLWS